MSGCSSNYRPKWIIWSLARIESVKNPEEFRGFFVYILESVLKKDYVYEAVFWYRVRGGVFMSRLPSLVAMAALFITCLSGFSGAALAVFKGNSIGELIEYRAKYEDTFIHLARKNGLGFVEMRAANPGIDPWIPGEGTKLIIPAQHLLPDAPRRDIVINLPEMRIYAYVNGDGAPLTYPIGIGREGLSTPVGKTSIVRKTVNPIWRPTDRMRKEKPELPVEVLPGPDNPMGTRALYLGWSQYAIHGTNKPYGIGRRSSSGCIRMYPESVLEFYDRIPIGTEVNVVNQPIKVAWIGNELYIEAHPDLEQAINMEESGIIEHQQLTDADMAAIVKVAGQYQDYLNWPKIRTAIRERRGYPIVIARVPERVKETVPDLQEVENNNFPRDAVIPKEKPENLKALQIGDAVPYPPHLPHKKTRIVARVD